MLGRIPSRLVTRRVFLCARIKHLANPSQSLRYCYRLVDSPSSTLQWHRRFSALAKEGRSVDRSLKEVYSRMTPLEHILLRPGMYIGQVERLAPAPCWVLESTPSLPNIADETEKLSPNFRIVRREHSIAPALIKVFDEILVNASDNRMRHPELFSRMDVTIHPGSTSEDAMISIFNDGPGIPIEVHETENLYLPELLFGNLLTGSNFDDTEKRVTGGRHGYGAKLTNIFSKLFTVETVDSSQGLRYQQTWRDNMRIMEDPIITETTDSDYTRVTFTPDIPRLTGNVSVPSGNNDSAFPAMMINDEDFATMCRRVVDIAGCCAASGTVQVTLNGHIVTVSSFSAYSSLYRNPSSPPLCCSKVNNRWEVAVGLSETGSFESISFVNGMATTRGGTHVNMLVQQICKAVSDYIAKKYPELADDVTSILIRRQLFVTCNALIENPSFDSQMKEFLTSSPKQWGSVCELSSSFLSSLLVPQEQGGPGILEAVVKMAQTRQKDNLSKMLGRSSKNPKNLDRAQHAKLEEARWAGTKFSSQCTLILTEGDSAKALAVAGLEVIGREKFGVFPLRGKFLNVRRANVQSLTNNAELKALCSIVGLDFKKKYELTRERATLRYGQIMLMTDQDNDGSHIKGLLMNLFRHYWPALLKSPVDNPEQRPFLSSFITPLLKATSRTGDKEVLSFYSMAEFNEWRSQFESSEELKRWSLKYYKGLGTSTPAEAKEYFYKFAQHVRPYCWNSDEDGELLDLLFTSDRAADRRNWILENYDEKNAIVGDASRDNAVSFADFINNEFIHFSNADNTRSLPSAIDGLKPSQRKVLYACFKRKLKSEVKVAQLTGYCAEHTAYHHGETSLQSTIIGMAQDFVGSNNINLLTPQGQFGTRLKGGKDAASPRYIFTHLSPVARLLFPEEDDMLLEYREDDGQIVEPVFYCPIISLLLVNGSRGIGSGWSTCIPPHNPLDVIAYIRAKLDGSDKLPIIRPWVRGFIGDIVKRSDGLSFNSIGKVKINENNKSIHISELPVGRWTNDYKEILIKMQEDREIQSFIEDHTTTSVSFTIQVDDEQLIALQGRGLETSFKLISSLSITNMNAYDASNKIVKFDTAEGVADAFFATRYDLYTDRKSVLQSEMAYQANVMKNKARFIQAVASGEIDLVRQRQRKDQTISRLIELGFDDSNQLNRIRSDNALYKRRNLAFQDETIVNNDSDIQGEYDYLLNMPIASLNIDRITGLQRDAEKTELELNVLSETSPEDLWRRDLDRLEAHLK